MPRVSPLAACLAVALACAGGPRVELDPTHDFDSASTWDWLPIEHSTGQLDSDLELRDRLADSIERELAQRGLQRSVAPDLHVACSIALTRERVLYTETAAARFLPSMHAGGGSYEITGGQRRIAYFERAALVIEVFDAGSGELVWRGLLEERVRGRYSQRAERAVARLLADFPPRLEARAQGGGAERERSP